MDTALRTFYHVPVLGWMTRDAVEGAPDARYYFVANIAVLFLALVYLIGYPFVIVSALFAAVLMLSTIVLFTALDFFENSARSRRSNRRSK
jgi:hypothetical protein